MSYDTASEAEIMIRYCNASTRCFGCRYKRLCEITDFANIRPKMTEAQILKRKEEFDAYMDGFKNASDKHRDKQTQEQE